MAPGGTAALVELRRELLDELRAHPELAVVDQDLTHLLGSWFNRGFLELRRIDWRTPAAIAGEADRLRGGARDPRLPGPEAPPRARPALLRLLPSRAAGRAADLRRGGVRERAAALRWRRSSPPRAWWATRKRATCAVFYSITNCQAGLRGISFGNFLIKQVAADLHAELPNLKIFATLSPVPGAARLGGAAPGRAAVPARGARAARRLVPHARVATARSASIRWRASTSATARAWSASTSAPTPRPGRGAVVRADGELRLRPGRRRAQPRGLREAPPRGVLLGRGARRARRGALARACGRHGQRRPPRMNADRHPMIVYPFTCGAGTRSRAGMRRLGGVCEPAGRRARGMPDVRHS